MNTIEISVKQPNYVYGDWIFEPLEGIEPLYIGTLNVRVIITNVEQKVNGVSFIKDSSLTQAHLSLLSNRVKDVELLLLERLKKRHNQ